MEPFSILNKCNMMMVVCLKQHHTQNKDIVLCIKYNVTGNLLFINFGHCLF